MYRTVLVTGNLHAIRNVAGSFPKSSRQGREGRKGKEIPNLFKGHPPLQKVIQGGSSNALRPLREAIGRYTLFNRVERFEFGISPELGPWNLELLTVP